MTSTGHIAPAGAFSAGDHFPLGQPYGTVDPLPEPPSSVRPFGLTVAVPSKTVTTVNPTEIIYDEATQIGMLRDGDGILAPLSRHTDGKTNTVTDGGDGQNTNRDSDSDHRED